MAEPILKKARRAPWPEKCKLLAMEKYVENLSILTGKFKGCGAGGVSAEEKERCWAGIAESINAISDEPICVDQLKKQITNIRQRANEKLDNSRQTGGGPPPKVYPAEKLWIENSSKRASVQGLQICLDSEGSMNGQKAEYQLLERDSMTCGAIPCKDKDLLTDASDNPTESPTRRINAPVEKNRRAVSNCNIGETARLLLVSLTKIGLTSPKMNKMVPLLKRNRRRRSSSDIDVMENLSLKVRRSRLRLTRNRLIIAILFNQTQTGLRHYRRCLRESEKILSF